jgi:hypothetical protein
MDVDGRKMVVWLRGVGSYVAGFPKLNVKSDRRTGLSAWTHRDGHSQGHSGIIVRCPKIEAEPFQCISTMIAHRSVDLSLAVCITAMRLKQLQRSEGPCGETIVKEGSLCAMICPAGPDLKSATH